MFVKYRAYAPRYGGMQGATESIREFEGVIWGKYGGVTILLKNDVSILLPVSLEEYNKIVDTIYDRLSKGVNAITISDTVIFLEKNDNYENTLRIIDDYRKERLIPEFGYRIY
ncbi:MAG: hypothetical protein J6A59_14990 [Lachnospiraceae bacterium]|nr:hypothetical protein [Lachnospiraceae bacterium]